MAAQMYRVVKAGWVEPPVAFPGAARHLADAYALGGDRRIEIQAFTRGQQTRELNDDERRELVECATRLLERTDCECERPATLAGAEFPFRADPDCPVHGRELVAC